MLRREQRKGDSARAQAPAGAELLESADLQHVASGEPSTRPADAAPSTLGRIVLIVKLAAIGDVAMALPMITALRARDPDVRIDWMCGRVVAPLLRRVKHISEVIPVEETGMLTGSPGRKALAVAAAWRAVAGRRYDEVFIAHSDQRYRMLGWSVHARSRRWLGDNANRGGMVPGRSHTEEYVRLVTGTDDYRAMAYPPPAIDIALPADLAERIQNANPARRPLVVITPGGARNVARESPLRRWPLDRYAELASSLDALGCKVVLAGARTDGWIRAAFRQSGALDLIGATDLPALVALMRVSSLVIGHDSGPLHLARLAGTPVVLLLGPTPPTMFFREESRVSVLWPGRSLPCAPCYNGHDFAPCQNNVCMQMIDVRTVLDQATAILASPRHGDVSKVPDARPR